MTPDLLCSEADQYVGDWSAYSGACIHEGDAHATGAAISAAHQPQQQQQGQQQQQKQQQQPQMQQPQAQLHVQAHELQMLALHMLGGAQYAEQQQQQQQQQQQPHSHMMAASPHQPQHSYNDDNDDGDDGAAPGMLGGSLPGWLSIEDALQQQEDPSWILGCTGYHRQGAQRSNGGHSHYGSGGGGGSGGGNNGALGTF
jgi:hypothetical protein